MFRRQREAAQQNSRHELRVDAMVSAPGVGVVQDVLPGEAAEDGVPTRPVMAIVTDDEVRPEADVRAGIDVLRAEDVRNDLLAGVGIADRQAASRSVPFRAMRPPHHQTQPSHLAALTIEV